MLFDHNFSTVSMCSERHCGIECGQKILPINGNPAAYEEYFCCVYVTLQNDKSQVIFSVPVVQILDSLKQGFIAIPVQVANVRSEAFRI